MAERLDVDIYAQTARDAAEPGVKDIVNLACSHLATARSDLTAKVYRKLGMNRFDWYIIWSTVSLFNYLTMCVDTLSHYQISICHLKQI